MASEKDLLNLRGAVISSFETNHYLHELRHTPFLKQRAKNLAGKAAEALKEIEITYYNEMEKTDKKDIQAKELVNRLSFIKWLITNFNSIDVQKLKEVCIAFSLDPNRLESISDKIHKQNGAEKV